MTTVASPGESLGDGASGYHAATVRRECINDLARFAEGDARACRGVPEAAQGPIRAGGPRPVCDACP